jgi:hypothetical protein
MGARNDKTRDECYKCGEKRHYAVVCPTKDQMFTVVCEEELPHQKLGVHNLAPVEEHHSTYFSGARQRRQGRGRMASQQHFSYPG